MAKLVVISPPSPVSVTEGRVQATRGDLLGLRRDATGVDLVELESLAVFFLDR
jgi:hypothetical protein